MPSPFPGMNPYLERDVAWRDFHKRFLIYGAGIIGEQIRPDLQSLLHKVYDQARYKYDIYNGPPQPPLSPEEATWAHQFVPANP